MSSDNRKITYARAINEALKQKMRSDDTVFVIGQGVKSPWYVGHTCADLIEEFGAERIIDTPVSENAMTGVAVGASIAGMKAVAVHPRMDFMLYGLDPIINQAANWHYMFGGGASVPVVIWAIINRGGEQGSQHSQALQALFAHIPGLKVVMPADAYSAKGLLVAAIEDPNPVVFIDDRWLYNNSGEVPEELYKVPIGQARLVKEGKDMTAVASSFLLGEAEKAVNQLADEGIEVELIDLRTIKPFDKEAISKSVKKTGKLLVIDGGWKSFGVSAEIAAWISSECFNELKAPVFRLALPDCPAPASCDLEKEFYFDSFTIISEIRRIVQQ
ncbi:MAG: transketolase C-terminal domain-containing protein [Victivallaceae bacterium]|nr:transketolase C-terminal domain-containing protein [Victivallaceae bacterium]